MIFEAIHDSAKRGELVLIDGGYCRYHLITRGKRRGQVTIYEILSQRRGAGQEMLAIIKNREKINGATSIFAKCPCELGANLWYARCGFRDEGSEATRSGRVLRLWRLHLD